MMKKVLPLLLLAFISRIALAQNADPGVVLSMTPSTIPLNSTSVLQILAGNFWNNSILVNTLRINTGEDSIWKY